MTIAIKSETNPTSFDAIIDDISEQNSTRRLEGLILHYTDIEPNPQIRLVHIIALERKLKRIGG
jgi:hypothetical protein